jgi:hypothetical protein
MLRSPKGIQILGCLIAFAVSQPFLRQRKWSRSRRLCVPASYRARSIRATTAPCARLSVAATAKERSDAKVAARLATTAAQHSGVKSGSVPPRGMAGPPAIAGVSHVAPSPRHTWFLRRTPEIAAESFDTRVEEVRRFEAGNENGQRENGGDGDGRSVDQGSACRCPGDDNSRGQDEPGGPSGRDGRPKGCISTSLSPRRGDWLWGVIDRDSILGPYPYIDVASLLGSRGVRWDVRHGLLTRVASLLRGGVEWQCGNAVNHRHDRPRCGSCIVRFQVSSAYVTSVDSVAAIRSRK